MPSAFSSVMTSVFGILAALKKVQNYHYKKDVNEILNFYMKKSPFAWLKMMKNDPLNFFYCIFVWHFLGKIDILGNLLNVALNLTNFIKITLPSNAVLECRRHRHCHPDDGIGNAVGILPGIIVIDKIEKFSKQHILEPNANCVLLLVLW